ncbi:hypothetical protein QUC31_003396 [Theobroma cacao]
MAAFCLIWCFHKNGNFESASKCCYQEVAQEIETEARIQNDIVSDLQMLMSRAQAGVKNGMKRLNRTVAQQRSNHILQVIIFGLACFTIVYLWSKHFKR